MLPWTTLRHSSVADWSQLFGVREESPPLVSLEIRAVSPVLEFLDTVTIEDRVHNRGLESASVDFGRLRRLNITGSSNVNDLNSHDLSAFACTANKLQELYLINTPTHPTKGSKTSWNYHGRSCRSSTLAAP